MNIDCVVFSAILKLDVVGGDIGCYVRFNVISADEHSQHNSESGRSSHTSSRRSSRADTDDDRDGYLSASPVLSPVQLEPQLPPYFPALQGCRNVEEFQCLNRIEEGTYGVVYRAVDRKTGLCTMPSQEPSF